MLTVFVTINGVINQVRERCAAESLRTTERQTREIQRLRDELDRCRAELRAELDKHSGGGGGGGGSMNVAAERARLLQKVALTAAAKRQADEALRCAVDADRQKAAEMRRLHDECRAEVARVSKDANVQIRRLVRILSLSLLSFPVGGRGDWRRRAGRPRQSWLRTVEADLRPMNLGLATAKRRAKDRSAWRLLVATATSSTSS